MVGVKQSGRGKQISQNLREPVETCPPVPLTALAKSTLARKSKWEQYARDRDRFARRILESEHFINPVLNVLHRERVFASMYPHS